MKNINASLQDRSLSFTALAAVFLGLLWAVGLSLGRGDALDYSVPPQPKDNFVEASFRCVNPDPQTPPDYVLVFIPGTNSDSRKIVTEGPWLGICKACHAVLVACCFRGIELGYDQPSGGTGRALDEAIAHFATQLGLPKLANAPLLLVGHSQGGNFTYNYVAWRPERVKAFAATKWMIPCPMEPASFQVPGIIATAEKDEPGRIQSIAKAFIGASGQHSKWAFLYEKGAAHDLGMPLFYFIQTYFTAVCEPGPGDAPVLLNAETGNAETPVSAARGVSWFPNQQAANSWKALYKPATLLELMSTQQGP
jgi:pimeloyl-ACP methyl ester carboxylesterase